MRQHLFACSLLLALASAISGCDQARQVNEPATGSTSCTGCHGGLDNATGAPPRNLAGGLDESEVTVGAHTSHLNAGVACSACHLVPSRIADASHIDGTPNAEVKFSGLATLGGGAAPTWNRTGNGGRGTCSNVYCHGAKLAAGGEATTPTWSGRPPTLAGGPCGSCHGSASTNGAPSGHGAGLAPADCATCHPESILANGNVKPAAEGGLHLDGQVQFSAEACAGCHGNPDRAETDTLVKAAPPADTTGATAGAKVGAHLRHLSSVAALGPRMAKPFKCAECHAVPTGVPHPAGAVIQFATATGTLAKGPTGTLTPTYAAASGTCASTYCHGTGLLGGSNKAPTWTGTATCGTCHFLANPPAPHPTADRGGAPITVATQCAQCHPGTVLASGDINVANGLHVNGVKDVDYHAPGFADPAAHGGPAKLDLEDCRACHGATLDGAPASNGVSCNACHGGTAWQRSCTLCHGDANRAAVTGQPDVGTPALNAALAAPPLGSQDESAIGSNAVGAHLAHVRPGPLAGVFTCQQCHGSPLPADLGHLDGQIRIGWQLAATGGSVPSPAAGAYPRSGAATTPVSCANYCHGATLGGGTKKAADGSALPVSWTGGSSEAACGTCHGSPPPYAAPTWHVATTSGCATCHGYDADAVDTARHVDGTTDLVAGLDCFACHGTRATGNFAPPRAASSTATATTDPRVGAHQAHVTAGPLANAFACTDCHGTVPASNSHANGETTLLWSALATTGGVLATPVAGTVSPGTTAGCANYCHGGKWAAPGAANDAYRGFNTSPDWTSGAPEVTCGSCHAVPPTSPAHAAVGATKSCGDCHTGYACTTGNLAGCTVNKTTHVNGASDAAGQTCASCHGTAGRSIAGGTLGPAESANNLLAVPPLDHLGSATSTRVGPHQAHANPASQGAQLFKPVACRECHGAAVNAYTVSHPDGATQVTFGDATTSNLGGVTSSWLAGAPGTCTSYCHGAAFTPAQRGQITTWSWDTTTAAACNSCHASPPADPAHAAVAKPASAAACSACHATTVGPTGAILFTGAGAAATTLHLNGVVDTSGLTCTSCHGTAAAGNAAPPVATTGAATGVKVGAHQKHLTGTTLRAAAISCGDCHLVPTAANHADGLTGLAWGALAGTGGVTPTPAAVSAAWEATPTCTNYCHGAKWAANAAYAGTLLTPGWTAGAAGAACGTCHKVAPSSTAHTSVTATTSCAGCHPGYTCTSGNLAACTVNKAVHLNGVTDANALTCASCHGTAGRAAATGALGPANAASALIAVPPADTAAATTGPKVGPHLAHAVPAAAGQVYKAVLCAECHGAAVASYTTSHPNAATDLTFAAATGANLGGVTPAFVQNAAPTPDTCTTYCHGAGFSAAQRGAITTWQWNTGITADCGSCHASPPTDQFHGRLAKPSAATTCNPCHATVVSAAGAILFSGAGAAATTLHIDGLPQTSGLTCTSCHGTTGAGNAAPPVASTGATTGPKVGAHQKHLTGTSLRAAAITCAECHTVPTALNHADAATTVAWTGLAVTGGVVPTPAAGTVAASWETTPTCTNYCHGGKWAPATPATNAQYRGAVTSPSWTATTSAVTCSACHLAPPTSAAHASVGPTVNCSGCHAGYDCTSGNLAACTVNKTTHLDGSGGGSLSCTSCHGTAGRLAAAGMLGPVEPATLLAAAPPLDTQGQALSTKVGPHLGHVNPGATQALVPVACAECHGSAVNGYTTTHPNAATDVTFASSTRSNLGGVTSAWTPGAPGGCTSYCHGATFTAAQRGSVLSWQWDVSTAAGCGSCHASPPADPVHTSLTKPSAATTCAACHPATVSSGGAILFTGAGAAATTAHIDGSRQVSVTCTSCHGTTGVNAAPPRLANAANANGVGAHQSHVATGAMTTRSAAYACTECHPNQTSMTHANGGTPELSWTAGISGAATTWSDTPATCATSACHGGTAAQAAWGGTLRTPVWTDAGETYRGCGACHASPPPLNATTHHPANPTCAACHPAGATATAMTGVAAAAHVDGTVNRTRTGCTECHGDLTATGVTNLDGRSAPGFNATSASTRGATAATAPGVGAHGKHLTGTSLRAGAVACTECHLVPAAGDVAHATGVGTGGAYATVTFGALSTTGALVPTYAGSTSATTNAGAGSCASNYCHGGKWSAAGATNDQYRGTNVAPSWTGTATAAACGTCHKVAPTSSAHAAVTATTSCSNCHAGYTCTTGNLAACTVNTTTHLNGVADSGTLTCASCHGTASRLAAAGTLGPALSANAVIASPPADIAGATTGVKVGPHLKHSVPSSAQTYRPIPCSECHGAAADTYGTGHPNTATELTFANATGANLTGFVPSITQNTAPTADTCATYCHGATFSAAQKGSITTWQWNTGITTGCGSCHGAAPNDPAHTSVSKTAAASACNPCHSSVVSPAGAILFTGVGAAATTLHVDGVVQTTGTGCTSCHGTAAAGNAAPPVATNGNTLTTQPKVGAHQKHLASATLRTGGAATCAECHTVPTAQNHANAATTVTWTGRSVSGGVVPTPAAGTVVASWETTPTCTNYCHGGKWIPATPASNAQYRGAATTPSWTGTSAQAACGSCHLAPPTSAGHLAYPSTTKNCGDCHAGYSCTTGNLAACTVNATTHLNGVGDAPVLTCASCHGTTGRTATTGTLGPTNSANNLLAAPPNDTEGAATGVKVGMHLSHGAPATPAQQMYKPILCSECHGTGVNAYTTSHGNSTTELTFANATGASLNGFVPSIAQAAPPAADTCTTYCHGGQLTAAQKGTVTTWSWNSTATAAGCGTCHGSAPNDPVHTSVSKTAAATACNACHASVVNTSGGIVFTGTGAAATTLHINGVREASTATCYSCHGTLAAGNAAPPVATNGNTLTTQPKVGAHQKHLTGTTLRTAAIACADCHAVPTTMNHATGSPNVLWGALATTGGLVPTPSAGIVAASWETTPTCTNYCHGGKWAANATYAGTLLAPSWTVGTAGAACGTCHKIAPTSAGHASVTSTTSCSTCHAGYTCTSGNLAGCSVNKTVHMNGVADLPVLTCASCHGTTGRTATTGTFGASNSTNNIVAVPPSAAATTDTAVRIGMHLSHSVPATPAQQMYKPILCSECHGTGVNAYTTSHGNSTTELTFANATGASLNGFVPSIAQAAPPAADTCTTYCHGGQLTAAQKGTVTTWSWNSTATAAGCGTCHGSAPNDPVHTSVSKTAAATACNACHASVVNTSGGIVFTGTGAAATTLHINGVREASTATCYSCHGTLAAGNAAPPVATNGNTLTTQPKVGAHQKHLTGTTLRTAAIACADCHAVPTTMNHATGSPNVLWGALATTGGLVPTPSAGIVAASWETTPTCTNYCHGGKWAANATYAGTLLAPSWTVGTAGAACGTCHKIAPTSAGHASVTSTTSCSTCHAGYTCTSGNLAGCSVNKTVHMNGVADLPVLTCASCHGTTGRTATTGTFGASNSTNNIVAVPPSAAATTDTAVRIGMHLSHSVPATPAQQMYKPILCSECHGTGVNAYTTSHGNSTTELTFANATGASLNGFVPSIAQAAPPAADTCTTYCHGGQLTAAQKGTVTTWSWNSTATAAGCGTCHGSAPNDPVHTSVSKTAAATACNACHASVVNTSGGIVFTGTGAAATTLHINGVREASTATCYSCHGTLAAGNAAPPVATNGNTLTTQPKVGAHQKHLTGTTLRTAAIACADCHAVPTTMNHATGSPNVLWGALATTGGLVPTPSAGIVAASWETTPTCTNYCHGGKWAANAQYRGSSTSPSWTGTSTLAQCNSCHQAPPASSGHSTVTTTTNCSTCHTGYNCTSGNLAGCSVNKTVHMNGVFETPAGGDCIGCHTAANGTRRAIVPEFALTWSHKRSAAGSVTKYDCAVCHMEGDVATGNVNTTYHLGTAGGVINLRDPDTGANIKGVTFTAASGASPGSYASTAADATFAKFSRNLTVTLEADPNAAVLQAQMVNFCLKCHDADGATSALSRVPTSVMPSSAAAKPFGTTIAGTAYAGAGVTAGGVTGGVTDVKASFATTNSSYHPVLGKQNNWYAKTTRMVAPWNVAKSGTTVNTTSWGALISCWDCHALPADAGTITQTVTAHGGTATLRGNATASGGAPTATTGATLCWKCHAGYDTSTASSHGTGSALSSSTNSSMTVFLRYGCNRCHASNYTTAVVRPVRGIDVHGVNALPANGTKTGRWSTGTDTRPYAFIRNTTSLSSHQPARIGTTAYTPTCVHLSDSPCSSRTETYTVGGTY